MLMGEPTTYSASEAKEVAASAALTYVSDTEPGYRRQRAGKVFSTAILKALGCATGSGRWRYRPRGRRCGFAPMPCGSVMRSSRK